MHTKPLVKISALLVLLISLIMVLLSAWVLLGSFAQVKSVLDALASDGDMQSFTPQVYGYLQIFLVILMALALAWIALYSNFRDAAYKLLQGIFSWFKGIRYLGRDTRTFFTALRAAIPEKFDRWMLVGLVLLGAALRAMLVNQQMGHDEAYTYMVFARNGLGTILRDYHLPNNHVFHSMLVYFSTSIFGSQPWAVRLPAMLAVLGLIPAAYLVARSYFNRRVGLLTALSMAVMPAFIQTSLNARGYPLVAFFVMLLWGLGIYLKKHNNLFAWFAFVVVSILGFFTLPMMLYGFGMVLGWLFASWLLRDVSGEYPRWLFLRSLILIGLAVSIGSILLYVPIMLNNGVRALLSPPAVSQLKEASLKLLSEDFIARVGGAVQVWFTGLPAWLGYLSLVGAAWTWLRFRKVSRQAVSFLGIGLVWILGVIVAQMTVGWTRIWFFLAPICLMYAFAGWLDLGDAGVKLLTKKTTIWPAAALVALVVLAGSARWWFQDSRYQELLHGSQGYDQVAAEFLAGHSSQHDLIAVTSPDAPIIWYYGANLGIEMVRYNPASGVDFTHVFVLVNASEGQSVTSILELKGLTVPSLDQVELVDQSGPLEIYYTPILLNEN